MADLFRSTGGAGVPAPAELIIHKSISFIYNLDNMDNSSNGGMNNGLNGGNAPVSGPAPLPNQAPNPAPAPAQPPVQPQSPVANPYGSPAPLTTQTFDTAPRPVVQAPRPTGPAPMPVHMTGNAMVADHWFKTHWKILALILVGLLILGQIIFQIVYPSSRVVSGMHVDGLDIGGKTFEEASKYLDDAYGGLELAIYFGDNNAAFQKPKMKDVGIGVNNADRLKPISYPFYLRVIPGSIWWAHNMTSLGDIEYTYDKNKIINYTLSKVGEDCSIPPKNATLKLIESQLQLVPSVAGGTCDLNEFQQILSEVKPDSDKVNEVKISIDETPAPVTDDMARDLAAKLNSRMAVQMPITVDNASENIPGRIVLSWLDFVAVVPEKKIDNTGNEQASLTFTVNKERMRAYLKQGIAEKLIKKPGVSKVSTHDFAETSRVNGANGRGIDEAKTAQSVEDYINNRAQRAIGATVVVGPTTSFTRTYSPTSVGFSALLAHYAYDNPGVYAMSFEELSAVEHPRKAQYRGNEKMPAAGIHSLYIGLTTVMEEHAGRARPVDMISGDQNATECLKNMFQRFDDGCRVGFYNTYGFATLTNYAKTFGLTGTTFAGEDTTTTANDVHKIVVDLYKNRVARLEGGQRILSLLRGGRDNEGLPATAKTTQVSHAIGEAENVFNDSAVIYSTNYGAYALTVLSNGEGTSWEKVAELGKRILALKAVKIPKGAR